MNELVDFFLLGIKSRALHRADKYSTTILNDPAPSLGLTVLVRQSDAMGEPLISSLAGVSMKLTAGVGGLMPQAPHQWEMMNEGQWTVCAASL